MKVTKSVQLYIKDLKTLSALPVSANYKNICVPNYPFDAQLLNLSRLYRQSREFYLDLGGEFSSEVCSMMRSLSAQDLFKNEIAYSPTLPEMLWFKDHVAEVANPSEQVKALQQFNQNSLFHEQNHRVLWKLLPPAPKDQVGLRRYLNFAESLVVALDLAFGDEIGAKLSPSFERMNVIFRPGVTHSWLKKSKEEYREYLAALLVTTYCALEWVHAKDTLKAVDYILPGQQAMNKHAVKRGLELSELFTKNTNPQWQNLFWKDCSKKLAAIHKGSQQEPFYIAEHPLDLNAELDFARAVFNYFGL